MKQFKPDHLKEVLDVLEEVFTVFDVDFYIIGAIAKDYWYRQGKKTMRLTKDIDFAILVSSKENLSFCTRTLKRPSICRYPGKCLCND